MAGNIKGIIVEIGGDTSALQNSLKKVNSQSSSLSKELRGVNSLLKLDPKNVELLGQKQTILNENIQTTQTKLNELKKIKEEADKKMAEGTKISEENYRNLQREIINTEKKLGNLTAELKQFNLENSNWTKAGKKIEEYGDKITKASGKINEIGNKASIASGAVVASGTVLVNNAMNLEDAVAKYVNTTNTAKEETEKYREVLENINRNNYGEGYEDIADSMSQVKMQLKDINSQDLQNITEKAIALRDLFGYDVSESIRAVKAMMDNFSISADEAFNLIAEGKKQGLDFSNELLDNVNEYSVQFKKLGLTADDMFNIFKSGAESGAFNLDKIGDAVKEFSIRAIDGSNTTIDGFKRLGLNADTMAKKFAKGGDEAKQAFVEVIQKIAKMDNKVEQSIVGVDLFGTMWEDLGPTVISSFSKMDRGISKSSNSMQESIDGLYNTTKKKAEAQLKRLQSLGADFGKEMLPVLEKLIDKAEDFISCLDGMSDAEKENVVKIGLLVAGVGPLTKAVGTAGQVVGTTAKGVGTLSKAIGVMKDNTESGVASVDNLAKILTTITNPIGLTTLAIGALVTAYTAHHIAVTQEKASLGGLREEVENQNNAWKQLKETRQNTLSSSMIEIETNKKLADELRQITDENGKVRQGYEDRAQTILGILNKALGTEYTMTGNVINKYQELKNNIDKVIASKKAEAMLSAYQEEYAVAMKEQANATNTLIGLKQKLAEAAHNMATGNARERQEAELQYSSIARKIGEQTQLIGEYGYTIQNYEKLQAASVKGSANEIDEAINQIGVSYDTLKQKTEQSIEQQVINQAEYVKLLKESWQEAVNNNNESQAQILDSQLKAQQQELANLTNSLVEQTSTVKELTPSQIEAWTNIANQSYTEYSKGLSKLPFETRKQIQESTKVFIFDTGLETEAGKEGNQATILFSDNLKLSNKTTEEIKNTSTALNNDTSIGEAAKDLGQDVDTNFNNKLDGWTWGVDLAKNIFSGMTSSRGVGWVTSGASALAQIIKNNIGHSVPKEGPLKDELTYMPDMINNLAKGIDGNKIKLKKSAKALAEDLHNILNDDIKIPQIKDFGKIQGGLNRQITNSTKTIFTTPQINFNVQDLDEAKLQQCFNYINKKFGSKY